MKLMKINYVCLLLSAALIGAACNKEDNEVPKITDTEPKPTAAFDYALENQRDPFTFKFTNQSTDFKEARWSFADDSTSSAVSPVHTFLETGTYLVKLIVLNGEEYWAQREETIKISPANLMEVKTQRTSDNKLRLTYQTAIEVEETEWLDGYLSDAPILSTEESIDLTFETGTFKEIKLRLTTPRGSRAFLDLFVSEMGLIKDVTNLDNTFSISHENGGGPDGDEGSKKLIDNDIRTKVFLGNVGTALNWTFAFEEPQLINGYSMTSGNDAPERDPKRWKVEGSIDGENWTVVDDREDESWESRRLSRTFILENATSYNFYRFSILELNSGSNFQMSELRLLEIPRE